jgi:hypothetical protein
MIIVKLSHPRAVYGYEGIGARGQSPGNLGVWGNYRFEINNDVDECDYWIVIESVPDRESVRVPDGNVIFVQGEPEYVRSYAPDYLRQFDWVVTWREDIPSHNIIHTYCLDGWWVKRTYDQLKADTPAKTGTLSVIASDKAALPEHRKRFAFINRLIGHFKDRLTVFGSVAGAYCDDKYGALAPFRYSIAIEAARFPDYWTEKIADCFLCETLPLYYGCPNITDFFSGDSLVSIDIDDYKMSIRAIEEAIEGDAYERNRAHILEAKRKVLDEYQVYPHLVRLIESNQQRFHRAPGMRRVELVPAIKQMEREVTAGWQRELMVRRISR